MLLRLSRLEVNVNTCDHILQHHKGFIKQSQTNPNASVDQMVRRTRQNILLYAHMSSSVFVHCATYQDRIKNVIQLASNIVSQDEAHVSVKLA